MLLWPTRFYNAKGRGTVVCPDCGWPADPMFGDHGGDCVGTAPPRSGRSVSGVELIRRYALAHRFLSMNELRGVFDQAGVPPASRGPAFSAACKAGHIRPTGDSVVSTDPGTKGHHIRTYASLIVSGVVLEEV